MAFLKFLFRTAEEFADGGGVEVEGGGEFGIGEAAVPEKEQLGVAGFHGGEGAADMGAFGGAFGFTGGVGEAVGLEGEVSGFGFVFLAATGGAEGVVAEVGGDAVEPRGEILVGVKQARLAVEAEEDFKGEVFGLIAVAGEAEEEGVDARPVGMKRGFIRVVGERRGGFRGGVRARFGGHVGVGGREVHRCFPVSIGLTPGRGGFVTGGLERWGNYIWFSDEEINAPM